MVTKGFAPLSAVGERPLDALGRAVSDLRISVIDRCNFRCSYCMPFDEYPWIPKEQILSYEEITRIARIMVTLGVEKIRLTGGEPLVRPRLNDLVSQLSEIEDLQDLCLTTNGSLLEKQASELRAAGLRRINVSIDTLDPEKFRRITRRGELAEVLDGLFEAQRVGLAPIKINAVVERGLNDEDIIPLVEFAREHGVAMRFIEFMDVGNANGWNPDKMVSKREILEVIHARYPLVEIGRDKGNAPSVDYHFLDGKGEVGIIASISEPFCSGCTRARLTADGKLVTCLFSNQGFDLRGPLRDGTSDQELADIVRRVWRGRTDRYSELRLSQMNSSTGYQPREHAKLEMITLGG